MQRNLYQIRSESESIRPRFAEPLRGRVYAYTRSTSVRVAVRGIEY